VGKKSLWRNELVIPIGFALLAVLILLLTNALDSYGIFRDIWTTDKLFI
jgi:hypothetical protein